MQLMLTRTRAKGSSRKGAKCRETSHRTTGAHATGIDLPPEFVDAKLEVSDLVGVSEQVAFEVASATEIPFEDDSSDSIPMVHVGMNIEDKVMMMKQMERGLVQRALRSCMM